MNSTQLSSIHTHTLFCDGRHDIETMCHSAFSRGLCTIGFSSHAPIFKQTGLKTTWHLPEEKLNEYITEILAARRRWQGKLNVYMGLELDYIKGLRSAQDSDIKAINPDYIIGVVHYIVPPKGEPFTLDDAAEDFEKGLKKGFNGDIEALLDMYWQEVAEMIALGGIDILGHADLYKINCRDNNAEKEAAHVRKIAKAVSQAGIAVEVNTGGLNRGRAGHTFPSASLLRIFREYNVPAIITADAHCCTDVNGNYDIALKTLAEAGYTEHFLLEFNENGEKNWRSQKLNY